MNAIGSIPVTPVGQRGKPVVWIFRRFDGRWVVRREGDTGEHRFPMHGEAVEFARALTGGAAGYKLFVQLASGRFITESRNYS